MALFRESILRERFKKENQTRLFSASEVLNESVRQLNSGKIFDVFLSHSSADTEIVFGLKYVLEDLGYSGYVDWEDENLNPLIVTSRTAETLKERMK